MGGQRFYPSEPVTRLPPAIDIRVLGQCNLRCPFCFGPRHALQAERLDDIIQLVPRFKADGVQTIVVTGGEPLIEPRTRTLLEIAFESGIQVVLSTNGTLVERFAKSTLPFLHWIALPLEAAASTTHDATRPGQVKSFHSILRSFSLIRSDYPRVRIKLGTVVTPANQHTFAEIPEFLSSTVGAPDIWKLYQVSFSSYASDNRDQLFLEDEEFERAVANATRRAARCGWRTTVHRNKDRNGKYLFVEPNGDAMTVAEDQEKVIGNFVQDYSSVVVSWGRYVDVALLESNALTTYSPELDWPLHSYPTRAQIEDAC
jgi:MoaA/NifB/PqqE/SkfB family radical SAM enzyme